MSILLKAKTIGVNNLFKDPKSEEVFVMRAYDEAEGTCLAERPDGTFWDCDGNYMVFTEVKSFPPCPECESNRHVKIQATADSWVCHAPVHRYNRIGCWGWNENDLKRDTYVKCPDESMPPLPPPDCPICKKRPRIEGKTFWKRHGKYFCSNCADEQIMDGCSPGYFNDQ